ncbi:hypothetical protein ACFQY7_46815 [Actinomadura luteofluorescens]
MRVVPATPGARYDPGPRVLAALGLAFGGVPIALPAWMIETAPRAVEAASVLWVAVFDLSVGLEALAGGVVDDLIVSFRWFGG